MVASSGTAKVTLPTDEQILITREFDAPRHLVYKAWTTPELVQRWWAGHRGKTTLVELDLRVGGKWRYVLVSNDGTEVGFHGEYREVVPNERLEWTEIYEGMPDSDPAIVTATFVDDNGRTRLELLTEVTSKEIRDMIVESGMEVGAQEQMDIIEQIAISLA